MVALAQQQQGVFGLVSVRGDDGIRITVSHWTDREAVKIGDAKLTMFPFKA